MCVCKRKKERERERERSSIGAAGQRMCGDVNFEEAKAVAGYITPVPGESDVLVQ